MILRKAYSGSESSGSMPVDGVQGQVILLIFLFMLFPSRLISQELPEYDELAISLLIPSIGAGEIDALIRGEDLYLPVTDLFDFLKIKNIPSPGLETITGFFINPDAEYSINRVENKITYIGKIQSIPEVNLFWEHFWPGMCI
jgi:hypothetical protein